MAASRASLTVPPARTVLGAAGVAPVVVQIVEVTHAATVAQEAAVAAKEVAAVAQGAAVVAKEVALVA